jgi:hypothetical protein
VARHLHRALVGLGAADGEERVGEVTRRERGKPGRQLSGRAVGKLPCGRVVRETHRLFGYCFGDLAPPVTSVHDREACEAVEELLAPLGPNPYALGRSITRSSSASHGWSWVLWVQRCRIASRLVTMGLASHLLWGWG